VRRMLAEEADRMGYHKVPPKIVALVA
jgi:hypothetical protein